MDMMTEQSSSEAAAALDAKARAAKRKRLFAVLGGAVLAIGLVWFLYWLLIGSRRVTTDDAYVGADTAQVTALIAGPVIQIPARETQLVRKGDVLAVIEPSDYSLAVARAEAQLGQAQRRVEQYYANDQAMAAQTAARTSDVARAEAQLASTRSDLARAEAEYARRHSLAGTGAVSADELTQAENSRQTAQAAVSAAKSALEQARANVQVAGAQRQAATVLIRGSDLQSNPEVAAARAQLNQARLDLERTTVRSPVDGIVTKKTIQIGQRVQAGTVLMNIVPVQSAFVDANFKEVQLRKIHVGSSVTLTSDVYGGAVKYHGKVVGVGGGSGSAFSLIPAQNATGNWIKVVQRVPVRITLDSQELAQHPLRVGVSMKAVVKAP
jgi:membrane fusion protein (multidrug efflux system)